MPEKLWTNSPSPRPIILDRSVFEGVDPDDEDEPFDFFGVTFVGVALLLAILEADSVFAS